jgi:PEP-CTERM motif
MRLLGKPRVLALAMGICSAVLVPGAVSASVISVNTAYFGAGSTLTTFTGLADGTEVDGLLTDGLTFDYSLGSGVVIIDGGPGITNNVDPPNIVSIDDPTGVLSVLLPSYTSAFGYGYAVLALTPVANATTIALYDGATLVGSLSYNGIPDPDFSGGFAGIASTIPFNSVQITFAPGVEAFAVDNIRTDTALVSAVPEPASLTLLGIGLVGMGARRWRQRKTS